MIEKHFVTFLSPGTFLAEQTTKEIPEWDPEAAMKMADDITERYGATPYGFYFTTRRNDGELDSKEVARSGTYFLGGEILTVEDVRARNDPDEKILLSNMENNGYEKIVVNTNSYRWTQPLEASDQVLDYTPPKRDEVPA